MSYLLCIETATEVCSVCISKEGQLLAIREEDQGLKHSELLTIFIQDCLEEANCTISDLSAIILSKGPGSYTGLRVGASVAKGVCYGQQIPLIAVDTLDALAYGARQAYPDFKYFVPMIDARRMEVYAAQYNQLGQVMEPLEAVVLQPDWLETLIATGEQIGLLGNGAPKAIDFFDHSPLTLLPIYCSAKYLIGLGWSRYQAGIFEDTAYFEPLYLKPPNITQSKKSLF